MSTRPFSSLGLKPYLGLSSSDSELLHKIYLRKSLELHPDRNRNEPNQSEKVFSELNADYQDLRNTEKLVQRVVEDFFSDAPSTPGSQKQNMAPDLALEYFEIIEDPTPDSVKAFTAKVEINIQSQMEKLTQIAMRFPYQGLGASDTLPWSKEDLSTLKELIAQKKYLTNILVEMRSKVSL